MPDSDGPGWKTSARQRRTWAPAGIRLLLVAAIAAGCGGGSRTDICLAYDALRDALRAVDAAHAAATSSDTAAVARHMGDVERLLRLARSNLSAAASDPVKAAAARGMLEAANYLDFMVGGYRSSGRVDFAIKQFASRELNRAVSGGGGAPLNC